jgi:regulator of RNase E activity RraA
MKNDAVIPAVIEKLRQLDSCAVANAIELFDVRLANSGFTDATIQCMFPELPPMVGYAATLRIRSSSPPMEGHDYRYRLDWLDHVLSIPPPRVVVIEDLDHRTGLGSFIGEIHANILHALGCAGVVTSGAVRDIPAVHALKFPLFAHNVSVSHAYAHVFDFGGPVEVGRMDVRPGDLIHGDGHGVQTVPLAIADKIPAVVERIRSEESRILELCRSREFTLEKLQEAVDALRQKRKEHES